MSKNVYVLHVFSSPRTACMYDQIGSGLRANPCRLWHAELMFIEVISCLWLHIASVSVLHVLRKNTAVSRLWLILYNRLFLTPLLYCKTRRCTLQLDGNIGLIYLFFFEKASVQLCLL